MKDRHDNSLEKGVRKLAGLFGIICLVIGLRAMGQSGPVIDNDRVTVWDLVLTQGMQGPSTPSDMDTVVLFLEGGKIKTVDAQGGVTVTDRAFGEAAFVPKGRPLRDTLLSDGTAHEIVIALKDQAGPVIHTDSPYPAAFPRPGSVKVLDNDRVVVWHHTWLPGVPTPMHFHDKDVVVAYRYDGALKSVTPQGVSTLNAYKAGEIRFNKRNRTHYEVLTTDRQSAVMAELK